MRHRGSVQFLELPDDVHSGFIVCTSEELAGNMPQFKTLKQGNKGKQNK